MRYSLPQDRSTRFTNQKIACPFTHFPYFILAYNMNIYMYSYYIYTYIICIYIHTHTESKIIHMHMHLYIYYMQFDGYYSFSIL